MNESQRKEVLAKGLDINVVARNIEYGATYDEACEYAVGKKMNLDSDKAIICEGVEYEGSSTLAIAYDVDVTRLRGFLKTCGDPLQAIEMCRKPKKTRTGTPVDYNGVTYGSRRELCEALGIDYTHLNYMLKDGLNLEEAVDRCLKKKALMEEPFEFNGVKYSSFENACTSNGISFTSVLMLSSKMQVAPLFIFRKNMKEKEEKSKKVY